MKLASYVGTRSGFQGLGNILIRLRLCGIKEAIKLNADPSQISLRASHSEVVFEPGDGVDYLMPDGTCQPNSAGELWCASSVATDKIPDWSTRRKGKTGGVRFKRINPYSDKWQLDNPHSDPVYAAEWVIANQGKMYDWRLIFSFIAWFVREQKDRKTCQEACGEMLGLQEAYRQDTCSLQAIVKLLDKVNKNKNK